MEPATCLFEWATADAKHICCLPPEHLDDHLCPCRPAPATPATYGKKMEAK